MVDSDVPNKYTRREGLRLLFGGLAALAAGGGIVGCNHALPQDLGTRKILGNQLDLPGYLYDKARTGIFGKDYVRAGQVVLGERQDSLYGPLTVHMDNYRDNTIQGRTMQEILAVGESTGILHRTRNWRQTANDLISSKGLLVLIHETDPQKTDARRCAQAAVDLARALTGGREKLSVHYAFVSTQEMIAARNGDIAWSEGDHSWDKLPSPIPARQRTYAETITLYLGHGSRGKFTHATSRFTENGADRAPQQITVPYTHL